MYVCLAKPYLVASWCDKMNSLKKKDIKYEKQKQKTLIYREYP